MDQTGLRAGETFNLPDPLELERGRTHNQHLLDRIPAMQPVSRGNRLQGLTQTHIVRQERTPAPGEKGDSVDLIRIKLGPDIRQPATTVADALTDLPGAQLASGVIGNAVGKDERIVTVPIQIDIGQRRRLVPDGREILALANPVQNRLDVLAGT